MHEECGVFALYGNGFIEDPAEYAYLALYAMQHRGQQSCGIAVSNSGVIECTKGMGLAADVFDEDKLAKLKGENVIAHALYSTAKASNIQGAQPFVMRYGKGRLALAHNGSLVNADELRSELSKTGAMFRSNSDAEIMAQLIAKERLFSHSVEEAVRIAVEKLRGAFSFVVMSPRKIVAVRDPFGFRPLSVGITKEGCYVVVSETCALNALGADFVRDVNPGEIVVIDGDGMRTYYQKENCKRRICIFEYIYFARLDSTIDGINVYDARIHAGEALAASYPVEADLVSGVPDS
ncbi:MAG: amidophosphoribosyltransferase, partial [Clostridia bacterium]|nr:amidophosphoribosyltransferase [Clostridia bacterium]